MYVLCMQEPAPESLAQVGTDDIGMAEDEKDTEVSLKVRMTVTC